MTTPFDIFAAYVETANMTILPILADRLEDDGIDRQITLHGHPIMLTELLRSVRQWFDPRSGYYWPMVSVTAFGPEYGRKREDMYPLLQVPADYYFFTQPGVKHWPLVDQVIIPVDIEKGSLPWRNEHDVYRDWKRVDHLLLDWLMPHLTTLF